MTALFDRNTINGMILRNRFIRSATWEGLARDDGSCTRALIDMMVELARGGVGLIITGHAYVQKEGQAGSRQLGVYGDELITGLTEMTRAVHSAGGKIVMQLAHAGCQADSQLTGLKPIGPSPRKDLKGSHCRKMTGKEINEAVEAFGLAAGRALEAGFDGVQIHAAHGYLLSQFLSPFFNKREDDYGGTIEHRTRIILEVLQGIRDSVGGEFPVMIKINSEDFLDEGLSVSDMIKAAGMLEDAGIDAVELSGGTRYSGKYFPIRKGKIETKKKEAFYSEAARRYKQKIHVPLMLVGGIRSYEVAEKIVNDGIADYISLCRPLIREPGLINRWKAEDTSKATCLSDNLCFEPILKGEGLYCVTEKRLRRKMEA